VILDSNPNNDVVAFALLQVPTDKLDGLSSARPTIQNDPGAFKNRILKFQHADDRFLAGIALIGKAGPEGSSSRER
jgi:hypothetical protein